MLKDAAWVMWNRHQSGKEPKQWHILFLTPTKSGGPAFAVAEK
jgi:hypothetical protein